MEILISRYHWLKLSNEQRIVMRDAFVIPRSGGVEMQNGIVTSDGSSERDLSAISVESMQAFTGSKETSFEALFNLSIARVDGIIEARRKEDEDALNRTNADERNRKTQELVESILATIESMPLDAQMRIKVRLSSIGEHKTEDVKESSTPKKGKKAGNKQGAEGAGTGGQETESAG